MSGEARAGRADGPLIRSERPRDADAVRALHLAAFGDHGRTVNAIVDDLRPTIAERGVASFVAEDPNASSGT